MAEAHNVESARPLDLLINGRDIFVLGRDEVDEIYLHHSQERLRIERKARRDALERKQMQERIDFEQAEKDQQREAIMTIARQIKREGIEATRKHAVPAYTFTRFPELPTELQHQIWSLGACFENPQLYHLQDVRSHDFLNRNGRRLRRYGSSQVYQAGDKAYTVPVVLHVCRASRMVAKSIHSLLPCRRLNRDQYFNTLYDTFYIGGEWSWHNSQILVDLLIRLNTTRPIPEPARTDVQKLQHIKHLQVDFNIFADLPIGIWVEFYQLESLTIVIYPTDDFTSFFDPTLVNESAFAELNVRSKHGKRGQWLIDFALESFKDAKERTERISQWKIPKIKVVLRRRWRSIDGFDQMHNAQDGLDFNVEPDGDLDEDDSLWYKKAATRMVHAVPENEIRFIVQRHHPR